MKRANKNKYKTLKKEMKKDRFSINYYKFIHQLTHINRKCKIARFK